jgi:hypothetical protein
MVAVSQSSQTPHSLTTILHMYYTRANRGQDGRE